MFDGFGIRGYGWIDVSGLSLGYKFARGEDIPRNFNGHGTTPAGQHLTKGFVDDGGGGGRALDFFGPLNERTKSGELVGHFVKVPAAFANEGRGNFASDA